MLGDVWRWAGRFRTSERNIGIDYWQIPIALRQLLDDTKAWIEYHTYPPDEIALRFHRVDTCGIRSMLWCRRAIGAALLESASNRFRCYARWSGISRPSAIRRRASA